MSLLAYSITRRNGRTFWTRVGSAERQQNGSISIHFDTLPSCDVILRDPIESSETIPPKEARPAPYEVQTLYCPQCGRPHGYAKSNIVRYQRDANQARLVAIGDSHECPWCRP